MSSNDHGNYNLNEQNTNWCGNRWILCKRKHETKLLSKRNWDKKPIYNFQSYGHLLWLRSNFGLFLFLIKCVTVTLHWQLIKEFLFNLVLHGSPWNAWNFSRIIISISKLSYRIWSMTFNLSLDGAQVALISPSHCCNVYSFFTWFSSLDLLRCRSRRNRDGGGGDDAGAG